MGLGGLGRAFTGTHKLISAREKAEAEFKSQRLRDELVVAQTGLAKAKMAGETGAALADAQAYAKRKESFMRFVDSTRDEDWAEGGLLQREYGTKENLYTQYDLISNDKAAQSRFVAGIRPTILERQNASKRKGEEDVDRPVYEALDITYDGWRAMSVAERQDYRDRYDPIGARQRAERTGKLSAVEGRAKFLERYGHLDNRADQDAFIEKENAGLPPTVAGYADWDEFVADRGRKYGDSTGAPRPTPDNKIADQVARMRMSEQMSLLSQEIRDINLASQRFNGNKPFFADYAPLAKLFHGEYVELVNDIPKIQLKLLDLRDFLIKNNHHEAARGLFEMINEARRNLDIVSTTAPEKIHRARLQAEVETTGAPEKQVIDAFSLTGN